MFALGGVSVRTLVCSNLAALAALLYILQVVLRRSFGYLPAAVVTLVAVAVFGFPHYWGINNYTYAAPYSHEATHGMVLLLGLVAWLGRPAARPDLRHGLVAGALFGLCTLTKTEYVLAGGAVVLAEAARFWLFWPRQVAVAGPEPQANAWPNVDPGGRCAPARLPGQVDDRASKQGGADAPSGKRASAPATFGLGVVAGALGLILVAAGLLTLAMPFADAARLAANTVLAPFVYADYSKSAHVLRFLGADNLLPNVRTLALWGMASLAVLALVTLAARRVGARGHHALRWGFGVAVGGVALVAVWRVPWLFCGTAFPALLLGGAGILVRNLRDRSRSGAPLSLRHRNQGLLLLAAVAMLARMAFDPTISHYGFFQALLAATWIAGFLLGEWPGFASPSPWVRRMLVAAALVVLLGGTGTLVRTSLKFYAAKTTPIGAGADRILGYSSSVYLMPELWELARRYLAANLTPTDTLLVIPEGISLNFWTRLRHPLRIIDLLPATLRLNRGEVVAELAARPPDWVVLASRPNMEELGYAAYGQDAASGKAIVDWVTAHYTRVAHDGTAPFVPGGVGIEIYRRKTP